MSRHVAGIILFSKAAKARLALASNIIIIIAVAAKNSRFAPAERAGL
jgi:hypothetical protein